MVRNLITYETALKICETYDNFNFSKSEYLIDGYKLVTFKYFLCDFSDFENPLKDIPEVHAYDMRGMTFVFNKDGSEYKRFLMLPKFFNLNQVEDTQYDKIKNKKIDNVSIKEDGSLIGFINLPNGKLVPKTIGSFDNEQTEGALKIINNNELLKEFIKNLLDFNFTPLFEYVSWDNRIVLKYSKPELRFIGARHNASGIFNNGHKINEMLKAAGTECPTSVIENITDVTLDELIEKSKIEEDKEGWVVEFEDGQMIKIKTDWYFNLHGIRTMNIFREDYVIRNYLEETLDDVVSQLDEKEDLDAFKFIERVKLAVNNKIGYIDEYVKVSVDKYYKEYEENWNKFATENHKTPFFGLIKTKIDRPEEYNKRKIDYIINKTKHLNKAKFFVDKWSKVDK